MPSLVIINGPETGKSFDLSAPESVLGRHSGVDIKLSGTNVSRRHSRIYSEGSSWFVEDLGSSNGTFLNGLKLSVPAALKPGDEIRIGAFLLQFESVVPQVDPELTIRARTAAHTNNLELFEDNPAQKLRVILELGNHLARSLDTDHLLNELLNHLFVLFPNAERGLIIFFEGENPVVRLSKSRSGSAAAPQYSNSVVQIILREGIALLAEDVQSDSRFAAAQSIYNLGVRSVMCVPLKRKNEKILGLIQLDRFGTGHRFQPEDLRLFTAISLQASVALENAQLHLELVQKERIEKELALAR